MKRLRSFLAPVLVVLMAAVFLFGPAPAAFATDTPSVGCQTWTRTTLAVHYRASNDEIILQHTVEPDGTITELSTPVPTFCILFGRAIDAELLKPTVDQNFWLALGDPVIHTFVWFDGLTYNETATETGYQVYFVQWHGEGLI